MPPKRKEDKKHDDDVDMSTLPPWITIYTMIEWESSLTEIASMFPIFQFSSITRSELCSYSKEKGLIQASVTEATIPPLILAKALSEKVALMDLQGRKQKRDLLQKLEMQDKPRTESRQNSPLITESSLQQIDSSKPDRVYIFLGFPKTLEEIQAISKYGFNVHFHFYVRGEGSLASSNMPNLFQEALLKSEKNSPLRTFVTRLVQYDPAKYQGMESDQLIKLEEVKFERNDVTTGQDVDSSKIRSSKTLKKQITKEVIKEESRESVPPTPDFKKMFVADFLKIIVECGQLFVRYLMWKEMTPVKPLFPAGMPEGFETTSNTTVSNIADLMRSSQDLPSLDDAAKPWDLRIFSYLFSNCPDRLAKNEYFFACILQQLAYSQNYLSNFTLPKNTQTRILQGSDPMAIDALNCSFLGTSVKDYLYKIYNTIVFPIPTGSSTKKGSLKEISYFCNIEKHELERMVLIARFEELIRSHTGKACVLNRNYSEMLSKPVLVGRIQKFLAYTPEVVTTKHMDGSTLVAMFFDSTGVTTSVWEHTKKIRPLLQDWKESQAYPNEFYDIDELKVGSLTSHDSRLFPSDGSVMRSVKYSVAGSVTRRCYVLSDDKVFGLTETGNEWWYHSDVLKICGSNNKLTCTLNGLVVACDNDILQELSSELMQQRKDLNGTVEVNRAITGKGTVIRFFEDGKKQILFANGNISNFDGTRWIVTNNRGIRTCQGVEIVSVPSAIVTDPETMLRTMFRDDGTVICYYPEFTVVEFEDGTKILTSEKEYLIESPCYAPVKISRETLLYKVLLSSGHYIYNTPEKKIVIQQDSEMVVCGKDHAKIGIFTINTKDSLITTTDSMGNFYSIGIFSEPKSVISTKCDKFVNTPKLFVISERGDGYELFDRSQIKIPKKKLTKLMTGFNNLEYECNILGEHKTAHEKGHLIDSFLHNYTYTKVFNQIKLSLPKLTNDPQLHSYRVFCRFPDFTAEKRAEFKEKYHQYLSWKGKQASGREFGTSEFSKISYEIHKNAIKQRQKTIKTSSKSFSDLNASIERFITNFVESPGQMKINTKDLPMKPEFSLSSPKVTKSKRSTRMNSSIESTLQSFNYFKSPEGLDLSFNSPPYVRSPEIPKMPLQILESPAESRIGKSEDNPFVSLVPNKGKKVMLKPVVRGSVYSQVEKLQELKEISEKQIAEEYHTVKAKDFDVYGSMRKSIPQVQSLRSSSPVISRLNQKYIISDILMEKQVRTISQTNRSIFKHPNPQTIRRSSIHSLNKSMIISDIMNDTLRRVLEIVPSSVDLGTVALGQVSSSKILIKNEDNFLVRYNIKQPSNKDIRVIYKPGPIAPGMIVKLMVELTSQAVGEIKSDFEIYCKSEIYTVNIIANVVADEGQQLSKTGKIRGLMDRVRKLPSLNRSIA